MHLSVATFAVVCLSLAIPSTSADPHDDHETPAPPPTPPKPAPGPQPTPAPPAPIPPAPAPAPATPDPHTPAPPKPTPQTPAPTKPPTTLATAPPPHSCFKGYVRRNNTPEVIRYESNFTNKMYFPDKIVRERCIGLHCNSCMTMELSRNDNYDRYTYYSCPNERFPDCGGVKGNRLTIEIQGQHVGFTVTSCRDCLGVNCNKPKDVGHSCMETDPTEVWDFWSNMRESQCKSRLNDMCLSIALRANADSKVITEVYKCSDDGDYASCYTAMRKLGKPTHESWCRECYGTMCNKPFAVGSPKCRPPCPPCRDC